MNPFDKPHRRFNSLSGEWTLVSPHRTTRPWQGRVEAASGEARPQHDSSCYLCPGNLRAGGQRNPEYADCFVFTNDFAAILPDSEPAETGKDGLFRSSSVRGTSRVICFSPRHDLTLPQMETAAIRKVIDVWADESERLGREYRWVQVFENKGEIMGCSNPHPHGQIWASDSLPNEPSKEDQTQRAYLDEHGQNLLLKYLREESAAKDRMVVENEEWAAIVPFWAVWPFETILIPRQQTARFPDLTASQRQSLAEILKRLLTRYDNLFEVSFPYTMGWHGAPFGDHPVEHWQLHAHFYPPLLRSATVRKFMVGYEMLAEPQRDITPELAAARLRELSDTRFDQLC
jgi:UDPglucose--hexose-1-phosphate uridylyltransferase